jgi:quercetin dioxygenase-like cupin family protein
MHVIHGASAPSAQGQTFTGDVRLTRLLGAAEPGGITVSSVRFEDGARTNWHEHPGEQVLYVVEGEARAGTADGEVRAGLGDIIHLPANQRHWHGAVAGGSMTHLSITTAGPPTWYEAPED